MKIQDLKDNDVIHCQTQKEADLLCNELHRLGYKWAGGDSYLRDTRWDIFKENTCYLIKKGEYCYKSYYKNNGYNIIPFSNIEMSDYYGLKVGDILL